MTQQLIIGEESIGKIRSLFLDHKWNKVLVVTGKQSYATSGAEQFIDNCLSSLNLEKNRFYGFANNPNINDLKKGLVLTKSSSPSVIIAIGGGSVLDMAKLMRFFFTHEGDILKGQYTSNGKEIPLISIPTTAGTGAETTHFAVLYDEQGNKHSIADEAILPDYAVIYPKLTYNQTPYVTACVGFDALAQAIEAFWNKNATEESDGYALKAIELLFKTLPKVLNAPTSELRSKMSEGAYWAGKAINITKTTAPHAFSYPFTSHYGIPHGHAVAMVFPTIAAYNLENGSIREWKKEYIKNLFSIVHDSEQPIADYVKSIGFKVPAKDYDKNLLLNGINLERLANNPAIISLNDSVEILNRILVAF